MEMTEVKVTEEKTLGIAETMGVAVGRILAMFLKTAILFFSLNILRKYGLPIYNFTFLEVFILRWAIALIIKNFKK